MSFLKVANSLPAGAETQENTFSYLSPGGSAYLINNV